MEIGEARGRRILREGVDVGRLDLRAEAAAVGEAEVVGDDDEEVGSLFGHCCSSFVPEQRFFPYARLLEGGL